MKFSSKILFLFFLLLFSKEIRATHNRAGEITFVQTGALSIHAVITLYTKTSSVAADRDSVEIFWGDGTSEFLVRSNGWGYPQPNDVKISYYEGNHTFPARGTYTMSMVDPNRIAGILNVNFPDSENVPFYLETTFSFLNTQFQGENNSVVLLQPPIDIGCVGRIFKHNPNAYDIDGDSISYELIVPLQAKNTPVPDYKYPDAIGAGTNNNFSFNEKTGDLIWDSPQIAGDYNVAFKVNEYRDGKLITSTIRDMQIFITSNCNSVPPVMIIPEDKCMIAGDTLNIKVTAKDSDEGQKVLINGSGLPFVSKYGKAFLEKNNTYFSSPLTSTFTWETACEHVANPYYQILFKAMDNSLTDTSGLVDIKIFKVKVSGPPPKNPETTILDSKIRLSWEFPYPCINSDKGYFRGFSIWRRSSSNNFPLDTCTPGLENRGYKIIEHLTDENDGISYYYIDDDIEPGKIYCYRILAEYAHKTENGFPYNPVQSLPSEEVCEFVPDDRPIITKVDVKTTDNLSGKIQVNWIKPDISVFDTIKYPPPYKYRLLRSNDDENYEYINGTEVVFNSYFDQDTMRYENTGLNTVSDQYYYKVEMYSGDVLHSTSKKASSVFLTAAPLDKKIKLEANLDIPWTNSNYKFYRSDNFSGPYEQIGTNQLPEFIDTGLINGNDYCYYVQSRGYYGSNSFIIINNSQISCSTPKDNEKPCSPELTVDNNCDYIDKNEQFFNILKWTNPNTDCPNTDDVTGYKIYYSTGQDSTFSLLFYIDNAEKTDTVHTPEYYYAGCYYITAIDASGNESEPSEILCAKSCPLYELPNTFTPNNDGQNDLFVPRAKRHIDRIDLKVYDQWGILVFETSDPDIRWDGTTKSGKKLSRGTYYYICKPYSLNNSLPFLKGFIEIIY